MGLYRFHFHAQTASDPSVREAECANDGAAAEAAFLDLRTRPAGTTVDVLEGARLVTRMQRPSDTFLTARSGLHGLG
ncbi:MAG TPA: hypothetical protein VN018_10555 [Brevundimonas sp.]|nr:hypothetical protein [Brevundimonas sp.]